MKLTAAIKYYLNDYKKPVVIFYGILLALFLFLLITASFFGIEAAHMGGMETASLIFLFVVGLNSFKNPFRLFLQTGISRRTLFVSFISSLAMLAVVMMLLDLGLGWLYSTSFRHETLFISLFGARYDTNGAAFLDGLLWSFISYMAVGMGGFFITALYYRMSKAWKLIVSAGVPVLFLMVLPVVDGVYFNGAIFGFFRDILAIANGYRSFGEMINLNILQRVWPNPYYSVLFYTAIYLLAGTLGFLLTRTATAKE